MIQEAQASGLPISVIIPVYNRCELVCRAIDSVIAQTARPNEILVVDDGSTDGTSDSVRRKYGQRVRVIEQANRGPSAARNTGIIAAKSDFVAFLDSDDEWLPQKLERQFPLIEHSNVVASVTNWLYTTAGTTTHPHAEYPSGFKKQLKQHDHLHIPQPISLLFGPNSEPLHLGTCIMRRNVLFRVGMFDERMHQAEDTRLLARLALEGAFSSCAEPLYKIYNDDDRAHALTLPSDSAYLRRQAAARVELLMDVYSRASSLGMPEQRIIRRALSAACAGQAWRLAKDGMYEVARQRGWEALAYGIGGRRALRACFVALFPRGAGTVARTMGRN